MSDKHFKGSKILLVEDEKSLAVGLDYNLTEEGYEISWAKDGKQALEFFEKQEFDLILLDIMLPYYDGFQVSKKIREKCPQIPILMLTARTAPSDRVQGLESGADDYITKPFHLEELLLRIKGMLKRKEWYKKVTTQKPVYKFGENEIDFTNFRCRAGDREFQLTQREALIMKYLIEHKGEIVSRRDLLENVWNLSADIETRTVDNFIVRLRKYFESDPAHPVYIKSVRSAGYVFNADG